MLKFHAAFLHKNSLFILYLGIMEEVIIPLHAPKKWKVCCFCSFVFRDVYFSCKNKFKRKFDCGI